MFDINQLGKVFSLCPCDGPPRRLVVHCDVRGNGFPLPGLPGSVARYEQLLEKEYRPLVSDDELMRQIGSLIDAVDARKAALEPLEHVSKLRRANAYRGTPARPPRIRGSEVRPPVAMPLKIWQQAINQMQWTLMGQALVGDALTYLPNGDAVPEGYDFSAYDVIAAYDDTCGNNAAGIRWNGRSYGAVDTTAFFFNQCAANQSDSTEMADIYATDPPKPLVFLGTNNCVSWGPRAAFAAWQLTFRHGRMIDRHGVSGNLTVEWQEGQAGRPAAWPEAAPLAVLQSGFFPLRYAKAVGAASGFSDRGSELPDGRSVGDDRPVPPRDRPRPPAPGVRETKYAPVSRAAGRYYGSAVEKLFHLATEIKDGVQAVYQALPKDVRDHAGCKGVVCMLETIGANLDRLNWGKAVENLALNELQDRAVGGAHGLAQGGHSNVGNSLGLGQIKGGPFVPLQL